MALGKLSRSIEALLLLVGGLPSVRAATGGVLCRYRGVLQAVWMTGDSRRGGFQKPQKAHAVCAVLHCSIVDYKRGRRGWTLQVPCQRIPGPGTLHACGLIDIPMPMFPPVFRDWQRRLPKALLSRLPLAGAMCRPNQRPIAQTVWSR